MFPYLLIAPFIYLLFTSISMPPTMEHSITQKQYLEWRNPRYGEANPQQINNPVWEHLIRTRQSGYIANKEFNGPDSFDAGPAWCFDRFGQSETSLPDGRTIFIAGKHEDSYDPDFFIYNDVVITHPNNEIDIYTYPADIFPPTDFHSGTLVGDQIILIGSLSYPELRQFESTQVAVLNLSDFSIQLVSTTGENPGWIHRHLATLSEDGNSIIIEGGLIDPGAQQPLLENIDDWELNLTNWRWTRLTRRNWPRWQFIHQDQSRNFIFELGILQFEQMNPRFKNNDNSFQKIIEERGITPDLNVLGTLYQPQNVNYKILKRREDDFRIHRIKIDNVTVRYVESSYDVTLIIEGELPETTIQLLKNDLLAQLSQLEGVPWTATKIASP